MKTYATLLLCATTAISLHAADVTWNNAAGDADWGDTNNWNTLSLPTDVDKAIFPATLGGAALYDVNLNGSRAVREIAILSAGGPQFNGNPEDVLTISGNVYGGKDAQFNTKVLFTADANIKCTDNWGGKIAFSNDVAGQVTLTFTGNQNNNVNVIGGVYSITNSNARAAAASFLDSTITNITLTLGCSFSDGSGNRTSMRVYSTANYAETVFATDKSAGALQFLNIDDTGRSINGTVRKLLHRQGNLALMNEFYGGTNIVTIQEYIGYPGTFVRVSNGKKGSAPFLPGVNAGFIIPGATNVNGTYRPNFMADYYMTKINDYGAIEACNPSTDYTVMPVASYDPTRMYRLNTATDVTFNQDAEMWAMLMTTATDRIIDLAEYDLTIGSGNIAVYGSGVKSIVSSGGKLVFGGDDIILYAGGSTGSFTFDAPIAWRRPAGNEGYPSLILSGTGLPEIIFSGEDQIGDYWAINAEAGKSFSDIVFAGESDKRFHGPLTGRHNIYHRGTGTITFTGVDDRRSGGYYAESGTTILANNDAPGPRGITNGAVCVIADGVSLAKAVTVNDGGILCMEGDTAAATSVTLTKGGRIEGGAPGAIGSFNTLGWLAPASDFTIGMKIAQDGNSVVNIGTTFTNPKITGGATLTVRVEDVADGAANIRTTDVYTVLRTNAFANTTTHPLQFVVENGSPSKIDTSAAQVAYVPAEKAITITGIRSLKGTLLIVR